MVIQCINSSFYFFCSLSAYVHWEDPPHSGYEEILGTKIDEVESLIQKYHNIPKDTEEFISLRVSMLNEITKILEKTLQLFYYKNKYLQKLLILKHYEIFRARKKLLNITHLMILMHLHCAIMLHTH